MNAVDRFADACLRAAAARWPDDIRDDMLREWRAEMAAVTGMRPAIAWRRLTFAVSLATSPSAETAPAMSTTWRDRLAGVGSQLAYLSMLLGIVLLANTLGPLARGLGEVTSRLFGEFDDPTQVPGNVIVVAFELAAVLAVVWTARAAARAFPQRGVAHSPYRLAAICVVPLSVIAGGAIYLQTAGALVGDQSAGSLSVPAGAVAVTLILGVALAQLRRGRRRTGLTLAFAAVLVGSDVASTVGGGSLAPLFGVSRLTAPGWFPLSLLRSDAVQFGRFFPSSDIGHHVGVYTWSGGALYGSDFVLNGRLATTAMLCFAFAAFYAWRCADAATAPAAVPAVPKVGAALAPAWARYTGLAFGIVGLGLWVYSVALTAYAHLPIGGGIGTTAATDNFPVIGLMAMAAAVAIWQAGRGPLVAATTVTILVPLAAGRVVQYQQSLNQFEIGRHSMWDGPACAAVLTVVGLASAAAAVLLSRALAPRGADKIAARRTLVTLGVIAALLAPNFVSTNTGTSDTIVVGYLTAALAWTLAVLLAVVGSGARVSYLAVGVALVVPGVALLYAVPERRFQGIYGPSPEYMVPFALAVVVMALATWQRPKRPALAALAWIGALALAAGGSMFIFGILRGPDDVLSGLPTLGHGYEPVVLIALGVALGIIGTRRIGPPDTVRTLSPAPPTAPEPRLIVV